jgi:hypothetical protein
MGEGAESCSWEISQDEGASKGNHDRLIRLACEPQRRARLFWRQLDAA